MVGRLIFYEDLADCDSKVSMGTYYGELTPNYNSQFKNTIYLANFQFQRSTFETNIFEEVDNLGITRTVGRTSIERTSIDLTVNSNLLAYYNSLPSYGNVYLEVFEDPVIDHSNNTLYRLERIEFSDNTDKRQMTGNITLTFDLIPETKTGCCDSEIQVLSDYLAYWDTNDSGTKNLDSEGEFQVGSLSGLFWLWQLYYESDGVTPLASGDVELIAVGVKKNGDEFTLGTFNGIFGDLFSDSSKWNSSYNIWDYFGLANSVGYGNLVAFSKKNFSFDHGFTGSGTTDNAISIEFYLAVNDSPSEKATLPEVYSLLTSYCNLRSDPFLVKMQQQQIGKTDEQPTLVNYAETRTNLTSGSTVGLTAFTLDSIDTYRKLYEISPVPIVEQYSLAVTTTDSGLTASQEKSTVNTDNLSIAANTLVPVTHTEAPISLSTPLNVSVSYWAEYSASFPISGSLDPNGTVFVDGVNLGYLDTSLGLHTYAFAPIAADEDVHTAKFLSNTTGGTWFTDLDISLEFQFRLYRYY